MNGLRWQCVMLMPKYFVDKSNIKDATIVIEDRNFHHIKNVMRAKIGDQLLVGDKENGMYKCFVAEISANFITANIVEVFAADTEPAVDIVLFAPLIKGDKMEWVIQKAVEIGIAKIIPIYTQHCVVKLESEKKIASKVERWNKIAESAAKQSGRGITVAVADPMKFADAMEFADAALDVIAIPYEKEDTQTFKKMLRENQFTSLGIFVGPEGGFAAEEIAIAEKFGAMVVTLGKRILRSETASIVATALAVHETNN